MHKAAKMVLTRHLQRLQMIEKEQEAQQVRNNQDTDSDDEEEEEESEDEADFENQLRPREGMAHAAAPVRGIPGPIQPTGASATSGPFKYGNQLPTKEQILTQYDEMLKFRTRQFTAMEQGLTTDDQIKTFTREKEAFLKQMEAQRDQLLARISGQSTFSAPAAHETDQEAFKLGDEDEEEEEESEPEDEAEETKEEVKKSSEAKLIDIGDEDDEGDEESKENKPEDMNKETVKSPLKEINSPASGLIPEGESNSAGDDVGEGEGESDQPMP